MAVCGNILAPEVCLDADDVFLNVEGESVVDGLERVYLLYRYESADSQWLVVGVLGLVVVEIHECGR